jgi:hypothetical protein
VTRRSLFVAAAAVVTLLAAAPDAADQANPRERHVYVTVMGPKDVPIKDVTAQEFIVREDGRAREVLRVEPAPPASHIALLVDDSAATSNPMPYVRLALLDLSRYLVALAPPPQVSIVTFGERPTTRQAFTTHSSVLQDAIGKIFPISSAGAYFLEAVVELASDFRKRQIERPMIVAFIADDGPEFSSTGRNEVATALQRSNASLWTLVLQKGSPNLNSREWQERAQVISDVGLQSGGTTKTIISDLGIGPAFTWVASLLTSQYRVTYSRPESLVPPTRLEVEVKRPNVRVAARRWIGQ